MSTTDSAQQGKGVDAHGRQGVNGGGGNESKTNQKSDEHILLTSQQPFYHQGIHQQYAMYPSGVTYSINPNQAASTGTLDYTVVPAQQLYQYPIYYSNTFPEHQVFEEPYQISTSTPFTPASSSQYHIQTAQYSGGGDQNFSNHDNSQGYAKKLPNLSMFDNAAANYTADWVKRTTLLPPEAKVPPELPPDDVNHDSRIMTPKNWGEGSYLIATTQSKPTTTTATQHQDALDQQLAQMNITAYSIISPQLEQQPPQQAHVQQLTGYAYNWPGTSQQQPQYLFREHTGRAYNASTLPTKPQSGSFIDIVGKKSGSNNNKGSQQQQHGGGFQEHRGAQGAQSQSQQSQIYHEKTFTGPKNTFNQIGNNGGNFVRNSNRSSSNFVSRGSRPNGNRQTRPANFQQPNLSATQHRNPPPPQQRNQSFPRNNLRGQNQSFRPRSNVGYAGFSGNTSRQMVPEFNPGVPPPALPSQLRLPMLPPPFPPPFPPFNMLNPQQQQYFRAFLTQVRPDAMMPHGPYGFDMYGQRQFYPGFQFAPGQQLYQRFNRNPGFNRGPRRGRGLRSQGQRFSTTEQSQPSTQKQSSSKEETSCGKPLDSELAESVNRGAQFDRDETKTPEPKGDAEPSVPDVDAKSQETSSSSTTSPKDAENACI